MTRGAQKVISRLVTVAAAIAVSVSVALLVVGYIDVLKRAPIDKERVASFEQEAKEKGAHSPKLDAEWERQTEESLVRHARTTLQARVLVISAIMLLTGAKWSSTLTDRKSPRLSKIRELNTPPLAMKRKGMRRACVCESGEGPCGEAEPPPVDLTFVDKTIDRSGGDKRAVIPILQELQTHFGYLPEGALRRVCDCTDISPAQIAGVSTFYGQFRHSPVGKHLIRICHGTACHVAGAQAVTDELRRELSIAPDADTDPNRQFTIEPVACMGCCTLAPVMQMEDATYGHLMPEMVGDVLDQALTAATDGKVDGKRRLSVAVDHLEPSTGEIRIGLGSCCMAGGSADVHDALEQAVAASGARATIKRVGCVGMCHQTPLVEAVLPGRPSTLYAGVTPEDARAIVRRHFPAKGIARRVTSAASSLLDNIRMNGTTRPVTRLAIDVRDPPVAAFLGRQKHIATQHYGAIDPTDFDEYARHDGFQAFKRCVNELAPEEIIDEIERSGLRGRGGAGFPTGTKWSRVRAAEGDHKYIICNGDEGDPGAFMDRMLMESFPYRIIEGVAIAAVAVGATEGYFYIRAEYPLAVKRIREALEECERRGLLGDDILGSGVSLKLHIMEGAGAFVCGEETALIASIEGRRGSPALRPPFPAQRGLWDKPTLVNNVETYATVPWIICNGVDAFRKMGTTSSKGTKVFALAGKVKRGGLIEVPMGVTIGEIVSEIGGGIKADREFKAVQIGGPSGGCIPASLADTPVDYDALAKVGAIMGSGGLVVLDDSDCMVDIARYFLAFTQDQSCGKCTFCRVGTRRMLDILNRLCAGKGKRGDLESLDRLAHQVKAGSLCGLGKTAPNPVLSTLQYFRDEYEAHIEGRCPAGKCKDIIIYRVNDNCIGCTLCAQHCKAEAIAFTPYQIHEIDPETCTRCDTCRTKCPEDAIEVV
ncbi:MAG: NAD(P)H-dependent oxidoreductase subunit E [Phycisphaerales bacterium]|nr:MAG: NAD(P)H-dependent oxidoreductase subunit E [Phycisphaerales bacterium]